MLKATVNEHLPFDIDLNNLTWDLNQVHEGTFHIIQDGRSFNATLIKADHQEKSFVIKVNGNVYTVQLQDEFDQLIRKLGMEKAATSNIKDIKAPMPGLVLSILVEPGQAVKKGESIIILEAMKMENVIKAPGDGIVKAIPVQKGTPVEKNQVLIEF